MTVQYLADPNPYRYVCNRARTDLGHLVCQSLSGKPLDTAVEKFVLEALDPASVELSLEAVGNIERERREAHRLWRQKVERAEFEVERAHRQYDLCEPENRLVARQLEAEWEEKLSALNHLREEYNRFQLQKPRRLTAYELEAIRTAAADIPSLWQGDVLPIKTKKQIVREVIHSVSATVLENTEQVHVAISWTGGHQTETQTIRPVARLSQLSTYSEIVSRVRTLTAEGVTATGIADILTKDGFIPPRGRRRFGWQSVTALMRREGIEPARTTPKKDDPLVAQLGPNQWTAASLARTLDMPRSSLYSWHKKGLIKARVVTVGGMQRLVLSADEADIKRLRRYRSRPREQLARQSWPGARRSGTKDKEDR